MGDLVVPVNLPDEGAMLWLDMFHQKNPGFTEISCRAVNDWAAKSGLCKGNRYQQGGVHSNDRPDPHSELKLLSDGTCLKMLKALAPLQARNIVVMEIKGNLLKDERTSLLAKFSSTVFKKVAQVNVGEPTIEYKKRVQDLLLAAKQKISDEKFHHELAQEKAKKKKEKEEAEAQRQKELAVKKAAKLAAKEAKRKEDEAKKAAEAAAAGE